MHPAYFKSQQIISVEQQNQFKKALEYSNLIGENQLNSYFSNSQGFGLIFTQRAKKLAYERFPFLKIYQELIPNFSPFSKENQQANAFYWNCLLLNEGQKVKQHIDGTLQDYFVENSALKNQATQKKIFKPVVLTPSWVTVLYLDVTNNSGFFELHLAGKKVYSHQAVAGEICHFRGDLAHSVSLIEKGAGRRLSLVQENYILTKSQLKKLSGLEIRSRKSTLFATIHQQKKSKRGFSKLLR